MYICIYDNTYCPRVASTRVSLSGPHCTVATFQTQKSQKKKSQKIQKKKFFTPHHMRKKSSNVGGSSNSNNDCKEAKFSSLTMIKSDSSIVDYGGIADDQSMRSSHQKSKKKKRREAFTSFKPELDVINNKKRKNRTSSSNIKPQSSQSSFLDQVLKGASKEYPTKNKDDSQAMYEEDELMEEGDLRTMNIDDNSAPTQPIDFFEAGLSQLESFSVVHETRPPMFDFIGKQASSKEDSTSKEEDEESHPKFSLLTSIRFLSSHTFDWYNEFNERNRIELDSISSNKYYHDYNSDEEEDEDEVLSFHQSLMYFRYPFESLPSTVVRSAGQSETYVTRASAFQDVPSSTSSSSRGRTNFLSQRYTCFLDSFRNIYRRLRHRRVKSFFYTSTKFVVQFRWFKKCKDDKDRLVALLSPSTPEFRIALRDDGIQFTIPYESAETSSRHARPDRSMLVFSGINNSHALYNFLLNINARESNVRVGDRVKRSRADVPVLYSSKPFLNASSCRLRVDIGGKVRLADGFNEMHILRLVGGPILPDIAVKIRRLIEQLQEKTHDGKIQGIEVRLSRHGYTRAMGPDALASL